MKRKVLVSVPATTANLGPGFDCLGLALSLRHEAIFEALDYHDIQITAEGEDAHKIPLDRSNLVYQSAMMIFERLDWFPKGIRIQQKNQIPIGSGLGSSSSAVLTGMFGANGLAGSPLPQSEILQMATDYEGHPDNVAPAVHGGLILGIQNGDGLFVEPIPIPIIQAIIVLPDFELLTNHAREILPAMVSRSAAIYNASRIGLLVRALQTVDYEKLGIAMQDRIHQPYRLPLIPGMTEAFAAAREAGAYSVALSGAGPSLIAFSPNNHEAIADAAIKAFAKHNLGSRHWILSVENKGVFQTDFLS